MATTAVSPKRSTGGINVGRLLAWILMGLLIFITLFPFWWVLRTALTAPRAVFTNTESLLPVQATLVNFGRVLGTVDSATAVAAGGSGQKLRFFLFLRNSIIVAGTIAAVQTFFSSMAAYAFARLRFPLRNGLFLAYIAALMVPGIVTFIPNFILMRELGWINTFLGVMAPFLLMTPFAVFFLRQFFLGINRELEEAAKLDGASIFTIFFRLVLPISRSPMITLGIITFITAWNEYLWPLIVGRDESVRVLTVALGVFRSQTPQGAPDWTGLMAGTTLAIVPTLLIFFFLGRRILDSLQFAGFK